jgi:hypothetical protein
MTLYARFDLYTYENSVMCFHNVKCIFFKLQLRKSDFQLKCQVNIGV